ncbi:MAG: hypothetical protein JWM80_1698, partial [Cyanobacteria bacterium RYN_339]|nr:hypothetical protein [Cyanobacteria bacterium RYN_339]
SQAPGPAASLKPTSTFIPAANVKANPAVGLAMGTAAVSPTDRYGSHLAVIAAGQATTIDRPAKGQPLLLALATPTLDGATPVDLDLSLDGAIDPAEKQDAYEFADPAPQNNSPPLPPIDLPAFRLFADDVTKFWVIRPGLKPPAGEAYDEIEIGTHLLATGAHCDVYVDAVLGASKEDAAALAAAFDNIIFPTDTRLFGAFPAEGVGGHANPAIVITPQVSNNGATGTLAFFARRDLDAPDPADPARKHANHRGIVFLDAATLAAGRRGDMFASVAHEFQHLLNFHHKRKDAGVAAGEEMWLDEAMAVYASGACGYGVSESRSVYAHVAGYFQRAYNYSLTDWSRNPGASGYGMGYLFMTYLADRFGEELPGQLVMSPLRGKASLDAVLKTHGSSYADAFTDFSVALVNDGLFNDATGRFSFKSVKPRGKTSFGELHGPYAVPLGADGAHVPARADVAYLFQFQPGDPSPVLRSGGLFRAIALVP